MYKIILFGIIFIIKLMADEKDAQELLRCSVIFESKKAEIKEELEQLNQKERSFKVLQAESERLLQEKNDLLDKKEKDIDKKTKALATKEEAFRVLQETEKKRLESLVEEDEQILKQIRQAKASKIGETYSKMKDSKSALILENLPTQNALEILMALKPQELGKILAKMDPKKAADLTKLWQKSPRDIDTKKPNANAPKVPTEPQAPIAPTTPTPPQANAKENPTK
ncbi:MotE family protein [Helicobacter cetorum]|uniref:magnesium transporter MgtE N-terminal domain-containing protein n=1 Tax=Helicobacter cetorum TaxID=138563 RepID=UPI000CF0C867|nr:MotE family protein [Helicobacter cetorum]